MNRLCSWLKMTHCDSGQFILPLISPLVEFVSYSLPLRKTLWDAGKFDRPWYSA